MSVCVGVCVGVHVCVCVGVCCGPEVRVSGLSSPDRKQQGVHMGGVGHAGWCTQVVTFNITSSGRPRCRQNVCSLINNAYSNNNNNNNRALSSKIMPPTNDLAHYNGILQ